MKLEKEQIQNLITEANVARTYAYAPYSGFSVGAALLAADGTIFTGCNVENAAFTPGNCAERTAVFKAVSVGVRDFRAIAIVGGLIREDAHSQKKYTAPCGVCRQVLREFTDPASFLVILAKSLEEYKIYTLEQLLPESFGPENL